ncbi:hypothetical protein SAMN04488505_101248 [Chitinophaga rupis]|uniref:YD repeat-containing protein n=1 Tax=Chitinophaga rupis TaxID=573321 RepID=A0A1H7H849_9BACT|nr:hypothetical protein [Chitinophaga rupis]SEK46419.1 hypothetical protein SAMN04488505_101248 [Chitinophaga rupis]
MFNRPYLYLAVITVMAIFSCGKSDNPQPQTPPVDSLNAKFLLPVSHGFYSSTGPVMFSPGGSTMMGLSYLNGRPNVRTGGLLAIATSGGFSYIFSTLVYDTAVYNGNNVTLTTHYHGTNVIMDPNQRNLLLENGRLKRIVKAPDTTYFYYNAKNQPIKTETFSRSVHITRSFVFDNSGNLQSVKSSSTSRYDEQVISQEEETFTGYDNKPNPLKGLWLWDDLYYRTVSANNFSGYTYTQSILQNGQVVGNSHQQSTIPLFYTATGQLDCTR